MAGGGEEFLEFVQGFYEIENNQVVRVTLDVPKFKTNRTIQLKMVPANGRVTPEKITERTSLDIKFFGTRDLEGKNYRFTVQELLHPIVPEKSRIQFRRGQIWLHLWKEEKKTWYPQLQEGIEKTLPEDMETGPAHDQSRGACGGGDQ